MKRSGLTLIELIVVLVILVGLAGIVVPLLPNMLGRTHSATGATNIGELGKWIQTYEQLNFQYPDGWDGMTVAAAIADYVPGGTGAHLATLTGTATIKSALNGAGIATVYPFVAAPDSKTFFPYAATVVDSSTLTPINLATGTLVQLNAAGKAKLNLNAGATYVVLGVGRLNSMSGKTMAEAPLHFSDDASGGPADAYGRYAGVFKVTDNAGVPLDRAILVSVIAFHDEGIHGAGDHIEEYYNAVKASK